MTELGSAWGTWGPDDETGAINRIGAADVVAAAALVTEGRVLRLSQDLGPATPVSAHRKRPERFMTRDGGDYAAGARRPGGFQFAEEVVSFATHSGTHVDALSHAWYDDQLYNGFPSSSVRSTTGASRCGAEKLRPMATRGLLLDLAPLCDDATGPSHAFGADDIEAAAAAAGVTVGSGDVVLLHTGWLAAHGADGPTYFASEPGIDVSGARRLAEAGVAAVGCDNYAVEVQPSEPGTGFPVHQLLIRDQGIPLVENVVLEELLASGRSEFLFVAAPLPLVGSTAGPVSPLAIL